MAAECNFAVYEYEMVLMLEHVYQDGVLMTRIRKSSGEELMVKASDVDTMAISLDSNWEKIPQ